MNDIFEYFYVNFNGEDILEVEDPTKDVCGAPLEENILLHQETSPTELETEERNIIKLPTNPQGFEFVECDVSPYYYEYDSCEEPSDAEPQHF